MKDRNLRIDNALVVTMNPTWDVVTGGILIRDGRIEAVGELPASPGVRAVDASGLLAIPGLVQTHVHLCQTLFRNLADDLDLLDWLRTLIWPLEAAHDPESLRLSAQLGVAELLLGGTTTILDMGTVRHQDAIFQVLSETGIRAVAGKAMMDGGEDLPEALRETREESIRESLELCERWNGAGGGRLRYAFAPRFAVTASERLLRETADLAREEGALFHSHAAENREECRLVREQTGLGNVEYLESLGILGPDCCLAHCIWLEEGEMALLGERDVKVLHCPNANLKLGSGIAPVPEMLARGISVSLGADGAPCNNNLDMFAEMRAAALIQKPRLGPRALPAREVFRMATIGGAGALGLEGEIGSIETGKRGDVVLVDPCGVHGLPMEDVYSQLVYSLKSADVRFTIVDGVILVENSEIRILDEQDLVCRCPDVLEDVLERKDKGITA